MNIVMPKPGTYVVAVSGGVDSMALLHLLNRHRADGTVKLVVAHLNHGIREDADEDRRLVQSVARDYGLPFVYEVRQLGPQASEATAREARYDFLRSVLRSSGAQAIITAHHQDDLLETAILNMLRGSGRKGLTALQSHHDVVRPLLGVPKEAIVAYAKDQGLAWREDSTNQNDKYLRNYIRRRLLPRFGDEGRTKLLQYVRDLEQKNQQIDTLLASYLHVQPKGGHLDRAWFNGLPHAVGKEVMAAWLRANGVRDFTSRTLERLVVAAKTGRSGSDVDVLKGRSMHITKTALALKGAER